jgi:hypothetical protein
MLRLPLRASIFFIETWENCFMKKLPWSWFEHRTDLPRWLTSGIGQIVVEWAVLERELEELIRLLMDVDIRSGRIVCNRMNAGRRIEVARNLIQGLVYHDKLPTTLVKYFQSLGKEITQTQPQRDMVAHGVWDRNKGKWRVLRLAASRKTPTLRPQIETLSRAVLPQIKAITANDLHQITNEIVAASESVVAFCQRLEGALAPLQYRPPQYRRRRRTRLRTTRNTP